MFALSQLAIGVVYIALGIKLFRSQRSEFKSDPGDQFTTLFPSLKTAKPLTARERSLNIRFGVFFAAFGFLDLIWAISKIWR